MNHTIHNNINLLETLRHRLLVELKNYVIKDTYTRGKNAGMRTAVAFIDNILAEQAGQANEIEKAKPSGANNLRQIISNEQSEFDMIRTLTRSVSNHTDYINLLEVSNIYPRKYTALSDIKEDNNGQKFGIVRNVCDTEAEAHSYAEQFQGRRAVIAGSELCSRFHTFTASKPDNNS